MHKCLTEPTRHVITVRNLDTGAKDHEVPISAIMGKVKGETAPAVDLSPLQADIAALRARLDALEAAEATVTIQAAGLSAIDANLGTVEATSPISDDRTRLALIAVIKTLRGEAEGGDLRWHGGSEDFTWNGQPMDADTFLNEVLSS